ncbi:YwqG [Elusimicrobium posterum]|uniref:YwqG family protein n=1 Tax=Elusimicrobium posterum TaxID=3116653 RepID=UPI003C7362B0
MDQQEIVKNTIKDFKAKFNLPSVTLIPSREETTVFDTKFGGTPYLPKGFEYPVSTTKNTFREKQTVDAYPLRFLAQLNFEQLPKLKGFPEKGILQFYVADDKFIGLNFDHPRKQDTFRVVYHKEIDNDITNQQQMPAIKEEENSFPFEGEYKLDFEEEECGMSVADYRFNKAFLDVYSTYRPDDKPEYFYDIEEGEDIIEETFDGAGCRMGGYPTFTQTDPREYDENKEHSVLLLQIDSYDTDDGEIMWGDSGVGNFFIKPEDLEKLDFSDVLYNWDCC